MVFLYIKILMDIMIVKWTDSTSAPVTAVICSCDDYGYQEFLNVPGYFLAAYVTGFNAPSGRVNP
jgi:hypothetical protein